MQSTTSTHTIRSIHQFLNHQSPLPLITPSVSDPRLDDQSGISLHSALTILREKDLESIALSHDQNHLHHHTFSIHHALYLIWSIHPSYPHLSPFTSTHKFVHSSVTGTPSTSTPTLDGHILLSLPLFALLPTLPQLPDLIHSSVPPRIDLTKPLTLLDVGQLLCATRANPCRVSSVHLQHGYLTPYTFLRFLSDNARADVERLTDPIGHLRTGSYTLSSNPHLPHPLDDPTLMHTDLAPALQTIHTPTPARFTSTACPPSQPQPSPSSPTHRPLPCLTPHSFLSQAVRLFVDHCISTLPVVDSDQSVIDVYESQDVVDLFLLSPSSAVLDLTVFEAISRRTRKLTGVTLCSVKDQLSDILRYISQKPVQHFVIVDHHPSTDKSDSLNWRGCSRTRKKPSQLGSLRTQPKRTKHRLVGMLSLFDILDHILGSQPGSVQQHVHTSSTLPPLLSNPSALYSSSSVSSSSTNSSAHFLSPTHQPILKPGTLTSSSSDSASQLTNLHTPLSLPMNLHPASRLPPLSPGYQPQPGPSSALSHTSHSFHPPPSAPSHLTSPVFNRTPLPRLRNPQTLSERCPTRPSPPSPLPASGSVPPPPMNKVAEFAAQMICYLWFAEPSSLGRTELGTATAGFGSSSASISTAQLVPQPEFVMFIHNVLNTTQLSHSVVLLALFYIHRLKCLNPIKPNAKSEYRIGVVSLMLANKMLDDHTYTAKTWSDVSRLPLASLNDGEIEFLQGLNFELHVNIRDFSAWFRLLHGMVHLKDRHTASALASKPGTRWTKKMRMVSGEGLHVLEGLVSPIRNSRMMKEEEDRATKAQLKVFPPTPTRPTTLLSSQSSGTRPEPSAAHPTHPYNLRRSTRTVSQITSTRSMHPIRQTTISPSTNSSPGQYAPPSWGPSPLVPANYSRPVLPFPNLTPLQVSDGQARPPTATYKIRPHSSYQPYQPSARPSAPPSATHKRNLSDTIDSDQLPSGPPRKRVASMVDASFASHQSTSTRKPPVLSCPLQARLPPIALSRSSPPTPPGQPDSYHHQLTPRTASHLNYLTHAIVPAQAGCVPELYFHSLAAGHRPGPGQLLRQEVRRGSQVYVFGSQPWREGTPMARSQQSSPAHPPSSALYNLLPPISHSTPSPYPTTAYSTFSNAGMPGVIWPGGPMPSHHLHPHQLLPGQSSRSGLDQQPWSTRALRNGLLGR